jgi:hypothetical protein
MAVQPPPAPVAPASTPLPPAKKGGCAGCGGGCLGCLGVLVLVVLLVLGGGYYFFIVQAQAGVNAPATLVVISPKVEVGNGSAPACGQPDTSSYRPAIPGEQLSAGTSVRTDHTGHAAIQYPDGSVTRISPDSTVTVTAAQLNKNGTLQSAGITQRIGRTMSTVQHLVSGASFNVGGHSVSAAVRGTEFEVLVRLDCTNLIKVFDGSVKVTGKTTVTLSAGQQVDADATGKLAAPRPIQPEPKDPFALASQCARAVSTGTTPGTIQTTTGDSLATGQTAQVDYNSPGGAVTVALCYPGSTMLLSVTDPGGVVHSTRNSRSPVTLSVSGSPGVYRATVRAVDVPGGEAYVVSFASSAGCTPGEVDSGGVVRQTISNDQMSQGLQEAGITLQVQGTSPTSAVIYYYSNLGGMPISWTIVFTAASPNLGFVLTQFTIRGVNVTTQVMSRLTSMTGESVSAIPTDFTVDRVYSCDGPQGRVMVIEGHR